MKDFKKLKIWNTGMEILSEVYKISQLLPKTDIFEIGSQIKRAAISIPSNIAEGSSRTSQKDYYRFLEYSMGSCFELETQLIFISKQKIIEDSIIDKTLDLIMEEQKMLSGFMSKIR